MARARGHLSVVRHGEDEQAAMIRALQQIAERVPTHTVHQWNSLGAGALFEAITPYIAEGRFTVDWVEETLNMPGLAQGYLDWLGQQGPR